VCVWEHAGEVALGDPLQEFQIDIAASSTESTETIIGSGNKRKRARLFADSDCFATWGLTPVAVSTASRPMGAENPEYFDIRSGDKIAVIERL
jgi:hypothetical protein